MMGQKCPEEIKKGQKESEVTLWEQAGMAQLCLIG